MATEITSMMVSSCLLLAQLLVAPTATAAISIPATTAAPAAAVDDDGPVLPLFPGGSGAPAAAGCWKAVLNAESCAGDILRSLASPDVGARVGAACCGVLQTVGDRCLNDVFPKSPFSPLYAPHVKHACGFPTSLTPGRRQ